VDARIAEHYGRRASFPFTLHTAHAAELLHSISYRQADADVWATRWTGSSELLALPERAT